MTDFNTWNNELIASVQKHLSACESVEDSSEFQYIIDAINSLTDDEIKAGSYNSVTEMREIPEMLRTGNYIKAISLLGNIKTGGLPQKDEFWFKAYNALSAKSEEEQK